ncbi:MAG: aminoglycoside phosphotransferase family protein [Chloroherpetonaceae bacterium]|nr:aminoglycoside phosphotransferase family protein [Chthonomonadaceae bacterium]MDW8208467.1 aminoglycoside phosphotransferase family protein [Chloroherpetonaceae bacterium]
MSLAILRYIRRRGLIPELSSDQPLSVIKLNTSTLEGGALVSLVFPPNASHPLYALRVARHPEQRQGLDANYAALQALSRVPVLEGTIPRPVVRDAFQGIPFTVETCLEGSPLAIEIALADTESDEQRLVHLLEPVCTWLWKLHTSTATGEKAPFLPSIAGTLKYFERHALLPTEDIRALQSYLTPLQSQPVPQVYSHNDMHPNNLLYRPDGIGVVDWERSAPDSPLRDLFMLFTYAYLFPPDRIVPAEERYRSLWTDTTPVCQLFRSTLHRYMSPSPIVQDLDPRRAFCSFLAHTAVAIRETGPGFARERLPAITRILIAETR